MKNFIKTIMKGGILAVLLVVPSAVFAATLNGDPQDFATLRVQNITANGTSCATCWSTAATANAGEQLSFSIYYHNSGTDTATNVRVRLTPQTTADGTVHTFTATVSADNAPAVTGTVTVTTTSGQIINYSSGSVAWRANQTVSGSTSFLYGQTDTTLFGSSGLGIGDIAPGWTTQGSVIARFQVSAAGATFGGQPSVTTNSANNITSSTATLNGSVNGNGLATNAWFEWGTSSSFGNSTAQTSYGTGSSNYTASISGLSSNTTYYYRAVAQNSQGIVYGSTFSFNTSYYGGGSQLPFVSTQSVTNASNDYATLNGYAEPNNTTDTIRWFEWGTTMSLGYQTSRYNHGSYASSFSSSISNLAANTTYYYRAVAQNSYGTVYGSTLSFTTTGSSYYSYSTAPVVSTSNASVGDSYATLNGYVDSRGTSDTTRWFEWGTTMSLGNSTTVTTHGSSASSFSVAIAGLSANTTYYYRAVARNSQGTVYGSTLSFTTSYASTVTTVAAGVAPAVTTLLATEKTGSTAKLNGLIFASSDQSSNAWFEWGTTMSLGLATPAYNVGATSVIKHSDTLSGLGIGQTYYYRVVAENAYGKAYGTIMSFVAEVEDTAVVISAPEKKTTITTVVTGGAPSAQALTLSLDGGVETLVAGEERGYRIVWKNDSAQELKNVVLRASFSSGAMVKSANKGSINADNSVVAEIGALASGAQGEAFITAIAEKNLKQGDLVVVTAQMVYTTAKGAQGDAVAYVTQHGGAVSLQGASIFGTGAFLPTTLFGWMLLFILVLILVLLGNNLYGRLVMK